MNFKRLNLFIYFSVLYFTILIYIVFFARRRFNQIHYRSKLNLIPFKEKYSIIQKLNLQTIHLQKDFLINLIGNIFIFIPFCFAMNSLFKKEFLKQKIILLIIISTLIIEFSQFIFNKGVADIDDVILNTIGGIIGIWLHKITSKTKPYNL